MNLQMDAAGIKDMNIRWTSESGLVENIDRIVKEYKESRHLVVRLFAIAYTKSCSAIFFLLDWIPFFNLV